MIASIAGPSSRGVIDIDVTAPAVTNTIMTTIDSHIFRFLGNGTGVEVEGLMVIKW